MFGDTICIWHINTNNIYILQQKLRQVHFKFIDNTRALCLQTVDGLNNITYTILHYFANNIFKQFTE